MRPAWSGTSLGLAAIFCGVVSSAFLKSVEGIPSAEAIAIRSAVAFSLLVLIVAVRAVLDMGGPLGRLGALRASLDAIGGLCAALSVFLLPLALVMTILATLPIVSIALSVPLLREPVRLPVIVALVLGFVGVALAMQPGLDLSPIGLVLALVSTLAYALRDLVTRRLPGGVDTFKSVLLSITLVGVMAVILAMGGSWQTPPMGEFGLLASAALTFVAANTLIIGAFRSAPVAVVAPMRYSSIVWAVLFDVAIWGVWPGFVAGIGIGLVVLAGLILLRWPAAG